MSKKTATPSQSTQFRAQEEAAFNAWREWPVFLVLRRQELLTHRGTARLTTAMPPTTATFKEGNKA